MVMPRVRVLEMASSMDGVMDNQLRVAVMTMRCTTPDSATWGFGNGLDTEMHGITETMSPKPHRNESGCGHNQ